MLTGEVLAVGHDCMPLGSPGNVAGEEVGALLMTVDAMLLRRLHEKSRLQQVLQPPPSKSELVA